MFMYAVHFMVALSALLCICVCDSMYVLMRLVLLSCVYVCALRARSAVKYFYVSTRSCFLVLLLFDQFDNVVYFSDLKFHQLRAHFLS